MLHTTLSPQRRRSDAARNAERIIAAAIAQLRSRPDATVTSIAREAGLGRVTIYGHFPSRTALVDAAVDRVIAESQEPLDAIAAEPDPVKAVKGVLELSWHLMDQSRSLVVAASEELTPARLRELHHTLEARLTALIERGQAGALFRTDLPVWWLVTAIHQIFHGAATDVASNRIPPRQVLPLIIATVVDLLREPETSLKETAS